MPRKNISANPYLSEYVYDLVWNLTADNKKKLSSRYWKLFQSSVRARNFADFSTLEEKMRLFSELEIDYALVISKEKLQNSEGLKRVMQMYQEDLQAGAVKEISRLKTFVVSARETAFLLSIMSQTIHHKDYFLNQQLNKTAYHIKKWKKDAISPEGEEIRDAINSVDIIDRTLMNCAMNLDLVQTILGVHPLDMKILLYLNKYRHKYISKEEVIEDFGGYNKKKISISLKRLLLNNYTKKYPDVLHMKYTLSHIGITAVGNFRNLILKHNNF